MEWIYKYISVAAVISALGLLIRYLIQKKIDSYFNKQLEQYKQELTIITENAKYDISKKLFDFEAYASKKHAVYPELYSLVLESWDALARFRYKFDIQSIESKKNSDEDTLLSLFYSELYKTADKHTEAFNYFYKNELYLSKETAMACKIALDEQTLFRERIENSFDKNRENDKWKNRFHRLIDVSEEDFNETADKMNELKEVIYKELSHAHFEKEEAKSK